MLMPADLVLDSMNKEFQKLFARLPESQIDGSGVQAIGLVLRLLREREHRGVDAVRRQFAGLQKTLRETGIWAVANPSVARARSELETTLAESQVEQGLTKLEQLWRQALSAAEDMLDCINIDLSIPRMAKDAALNALVTFEAEDALGQLGGGANAGTGEVDMQITRDKLTAYLRAHSSDPTLEVTSLQPLPGGFGKETIIFATKGKILNGEFVMRRDVGNNAALENDCHVIANEFPVIRAARERGFPAPDALWLDTEHALLPGSDFIVMRRAPGKIGGNFFGAQTEVPGDLADALAVNMAQLHTLPPLLELGDHTDSIRRDWWGLSKRDCIELYIRGWYDFWRKEAHTPSPALASIYGWLFDNIPNRKGPPCLLHGDIGFHNFLFDKGALTAVLDWEFAHIGDPAEELGYVKVTVGASLDWDRLMAKYQMAGGEPVDSNTLRFFQVWAYVRNASAANVLSNRFVAGRADDLKLSVLPYMHIPHFIRGAQALIANN